MLSPSKSPTPPKSLFIYILCKHNDHYKQQQQHKLLTPLSLPYTHTQTHPLQNKIPNKQDGRSVKRKIEKNSK
jgi:hypothetical protein